MVDQKFNRKEHWPKRNCRWYRPHDSHWLNRNGITTLLGSCRMHIWTEIANLASSWNKHRAYAVLAKLAVPNAATRLVSLDPFLLKLDKRQNGTGKHYYYNSLCVSASCISLWSWSWLEHSLCTLCSAGNKKGGDGGAEKSGGDVWHTSA